MHILGKVLLGLILVVLIPASILLTTMALDVRSKWQAQIEQRQDRLAQTQSRLTEARVRVSDLESELQRRTYAWGEVWDAPNSEPLPGSPGVQLGVGTSRGLGRNIQAGKQPRVYVFADGGEASAYIGEFELVQVDTDRAAAQLPRPPFPGEMQSWPRGNYRVRDTIPANWLSTVAQLESQIVVTSSKLGMQREQERVVTRQLANSQAVLDQRLAELNGDANAPEGASQELLDGLVETLRKLENDRNATLKDVHALRVKLVEDYTELEQLIASNRSSVEQRQAGSAKPKAAVAAQQTTSSDR